MSEMLSTPKTYPLGLNMHNQIGAKISISNSLLI